MHTNHRCFVNPICTIYVLYYAVLSECGRILFRGISSIQPYPLCLAHYNSPLISVLHGGLLVGPNSSAPSAGKNICKAGVRLVLHYGMPGNLVAYSQESGRVGHGGALSRCVLFASNADISPNDEDDHSPSTRFYQKCSQGGRHACAGNTSTALHVSTMKHRGPERGL